MKIICIGRNYTAHAKELGNLIPSEPVFFIKPESALLLNNSPFYYPGFSSDIHYEVEVVVRINCRGKLIPVELAHHYYSEVALGIDFTARDIQRYCQEKGLPWEKSKSFDQAAVLSDFISLTKLPPVDNLNFQLACNNKLVQIGNTSQMRFTINQLVTFLSQYLTLNAGDLIYTGTPAGVGPIVIGDTLTGKLEGNLMFNFEVRG